MGIDIYARWKGQTKQEKEAQYTGFSIVDGKVGYLRESYGNPIYVTHEFVKEAFDGDVKITAKILRDRLPEALKRVEERYKGDECVGQVKQSFIDFVDLCEKKEKETGEPCTIIASY